MPITSRLTRTRKKESPPSGWFSDFLSSLVFVSLIVLGIAALLGLVAWVFQELWSYSVVSALTVAREITFKQAVGMIVLIGIFTNTSTSHSTSKKRG